MKKSLLALAVLGAFAGAASAQSSVTIYGLVDLGINKGNGGTSVNPGANGTSEAWIMKQAASSRLGFRGTEDLGGGLSAQFQIEHRFNPDMGNENTPGIFWAGRTYVQLTSASIGSVYLGREYDPAFWPAVKSDPFGWDGVGQISTLQYAGYADIGGGSSIRTANTLGYRSANWGGLTVQAAYAFGEHAGIGGAPAVANNYVGAQMGFNVEYAAGPIYAALGYLTAKEGITDGNSLLNLALHWDFGFAKLIGYYAKADVGTASNDVFELAARVPLGGGVIKAAYAKLDTDTGFAVPDTNKLGLGYDYPLSKRTNVYFDIGVGDSDNLSKNTAYSFGLKHVF